MPFLPLSQSFSLWFLYQLHQLPGVLAKNTDLGRGRWRLPWTFSKFLGDEVQENCCFKYELLGDFEVK